MKNPIVWIEIPVIQMNRAIDFYNYVFGWNLNSFPMGPLEMAMFPSDPDSHGTSGALVFHQDGYYSISKDHSGPVIYLQCDKINDTLARINTKGGSTVMDKKLISEDHGSMALFLDSEGNRIALYSLEK